MDIEMKAKFPLIQLLYFAKYCIYGLYDGHVNSFLFLSEEEFYIVRKWVSDNCKKKFSLQELNFIKQIKRAGFLKDGVRKNRVDSSDENITNVLNYSQERASRRKLTLEITDKCNLRCKYCRYTINEIKKTGKSHDNKVMKSKVYKKAIQEFIEDYCRTIDRLPIELQKDYLIKNPPIIGLYGGEVLIYKRVVRNIVDFIKKIHFPFDKKYICIAITTNGTLLDEDFIEFCIKEEVYLQISIDGPRSEHDKNRVFASGRGSFEKVYNAIEILRNKYPDFFKSHVSFQAVQAPNYDKKEVLDFFRTMNSNGRFAGVNSFRFLEFADYYLSSIGFKSKSKRNILEIYNNVVYDLMDRVEEYESNCKDEASLIRCYQLDIELKDVFSKVYEMLTRIFETPKLADNFFNSCYLLKTNTFVACNGEIHICERTDFSQPVGDIGNGIDVEKIFDLYKKFFQIMNSIKCKACWAATLCPICIAQLIQDGKVGYPEDERCIAIRQNSRILIEILFILSSKYPRTFNAIQEIFSVSTDASLDEFITQQEFEIE